MAAKAQKAQKSELLPTPFAQREMTTPFALFVPFAAIQFRTYSFAELLFNDGRFVYPFFSGDLRLSSFESTAFAESETCGSFIRKLISRDPDSSQVVPYQPNLFNYDRWFGESKQNAHIFWKTPGWDCDCPIPARRVFSHM